MFHVRSLKIASKVEHLQGEKILGISVADPRCLLRIWIFPSLDLGSGFFHPRSRIRIRNTEFTKNSSIFNPKLLHSS